MRRLQAPLAILLLLCLLGIVILQFLARPRPDPLFEIMDAMQSLDHLSERLHGSSRDQTFAWAAITARSRHLSSENAEAIVDFMAEGTSGDKYSDLLCQVAGERPELFEVLVVDTLTRRRRPPNGLSAVGASMLLRSLQRIDPHYPEDAESASSPDGVNRIRGVYEERESERTQ